MTDIEALIARLEKRIVLTTNDGVWEPVPDPDCVDAIQALRALSGAVEAERELREAATEYAMNYLRDELDDPGLCFSEMHHAQIARLFAAIRTPIAPAMTEDKAGKEEA